MDAATQIDSLRVTAILTGAEARGHGAPAPCDTVGLDHDARQIRRRRLVTDAGRAILVDLPAAVALRDGDILLLADGGGVAVRAAEEALIEVTGDLPRLAWHLGNRHAACQILPDRLLIRADHVLCDMLAGLGGACREVRAPFEPERGAYAHGHAPAHDQVPGHGQGTGSGGAHGHGHVHAHGHDHGHDHGHGDIGGPARRDHGDDRAFG